MYFEAIHPNYYISPCEWPIPSWFLALLFKHLLISQMFSITDLRSNILGIGLIHITLINLWQKTVQIKKLYSGRKLLISLLKNGKIHFCIDFLYTRYVALNAQYSGFCTRDGTILWCINVLQYIMFQCVYWYCKLSIEASIYQCIAVYWSIKCSVKSVKIFKMMYFVENTKKPSTLL